MISYLTGRVASVGPSAIVLDVHGFGMELTVSARALATFQLGELATVPAVLVVREDAWTLYGFADADERSIFTIVQTARGIGPKVALNLLSVLHPDQLRKAVAEADVAALTAAPGIGTKGAQRLVLDLRDRLGAISSVPTTGPDQITGRWQADVVAALTGLGWQSGDASKAVAAVASEAEPGGRGLDPDGQPNVGTLLRLALRSLDRQAMP